MQQVRGRKNIYFYYLNTYSCQQSYVSLCWLLHIHVPRETPILKRGRGKEADISISALYLSFTSKNPYPNLLVIYKKSITWEPSISTPISRQCDIATGSIRQLLPKAIWTVPHQTWSAEPEPTCFCVNKPPPMKFKGNQKSHKEGGDHSMV